MENAVLAENLVGMFNMVIHPQGRTHEFTHKYAKMSDSVVVGTTEEFDCDSDVLSEVNTLEL